MDKSEAETINVDENVRNDDEPVKKIPQYKAAIVVSLIVFVSGTIMGWTSPTIPILRSGNYTITITEAEESWVGSLLPMGSIIGPFPGGMSADYLGRKKSILVTSIIILSSWSILTVARSAVYLYIGRLVAGIGMGWGMTVLPMYIGEIASPDVRGALGVCGQIQICLGFLFVYSTGPFVSYLTLCLLCCVPTIILFLAMFSIPETPYFLIKKNSLEQASKSLQWLRGQSKAGVKKELNLIEVEVEHSLKNEGTWKDTFMIRGNRRAINIIAALMAIQQFSGINVVLFNSQTIFEKAHSSLLPSIATILLSVVMLIVSFAAPYLIEKLGRRLTMLISSAGLAVTLGIMGAFFYMDYLKMNIENLGWLPLTAMMLYISLYSIGAGPVPWAMIAEVFAPNIRGKGAAFSAAFSWFLAFLMTNLFHPLQTALGLYGAFWIFSLCCALGTVTLYFILPETKGKTLQEIQNELNRE